MNGESSAISVIVMMLSMMGTMGMITGLMRFNAKEKWKRVSREDQERVYEMMEANAARDQLYEEIKRAVKKSRGQ